MRALAIKLAEDIDRNGPDAQVTRELRMVLLDIAPAVMGGEEDAADELARARARRRAAAGMPPAPGVGQ
jgi:hypothetical protein